MPTVDVRDAETQLSRLIDAAAAGEDVFIERGGRSVAKLVPVLPIPTTEPRQFGQLKGLFVVPPDFDAPLPDELLDLFEGL